MWPARGRREFSSREPVFSPATCRAEDMSAGEPAECHRSPIRIASFAPTMSPRRLKMSSILECSSREVPTRRHRPLVLPDFVENDRNIRVPSHVESPLSLRRTRRDAPLLVPKRSMRRVAAVGDDSPSLNAERARLSSTSARVSERDPDCRAAAVANPRSDRELRRPSAPGIECRGGGGNSIIVRHVSPSSATPTSRGRASSGQCRTASMRRRVVTSPLELARRCWLRGRGGPRVNGTPDRLPAKRSICMVVARPTQTLCHRQ